MIRYLVFFLGFFSAQILEVGAETERRTHAGVSAFRSAYQAWDADGFSRAADLLREACTEAPEAARNFYWLGVTEFHLLICLRGGAMDQAIAALEQALERNPDHAECHALLGTLYGMKIEGKFLRALRFGRRIQRHQERALTLGAENPRVLYLLGTCLFHTAKNQADYREILKILRQAEKRFQKEFPNPVDPLDPRWGYDNCLAFTGLTLELLEQPAEAADYFKQALERQPRHRLAREGLKRVNSSE